MIDEKLLESLGITLNGYDPNDIEDAINQLIDKTTEVKKTFREINDLMAQLRARQ